MQEPIIRESLVDIRTVEIDNKLSREEKVKSFVAQVKNPYCFLVGDVVVRVAYSGNQRTLNDQFSNILASL